MCVCVAVARCSLKNISNDVERCLSLVRYYILGSFFFWVVCSLVFFFFFLICYVHLFSYATQSLVC